MITACWLLPPRGPHPFPGRDLTPHPFHPQVPLDERIIFSGNLFQYQEDNKKWRNRFSLVPHNYGLVLYDNKVVSEAPAATRSGPQSSWSIFPVPRVLLQSSVPLPQVILTT
jgi:hypothetical protein